MSTAHHRESSGNAAKGVTLTIDLEERTGSGTESRTEEVMDRVLEFLADRDVRSTVFVVGTLASERPALVKRVAAAGHEIGLHGVEHVRLASLDPESFSALGAAARAELQDLTGQAVLGFRAPWFSLTPEVPWAPEAIAAAGFSYSSSVHSTRHPNSAGFASAPRAPFAWPCGLIEFPCPVAWGLPVGGAHLRIFPGKFVDLLTRSIQDSAPWLYVHPYDFDDAEPISRITGTTWMENRVMFFRRRLMFARVDRALGFRAGPPLVDRASAFAPGSLPTFELPTVSSTKASERRSSPA